MRIGLANDHRGRELKNKIIEYLNKHDIDYVDYGSNKEESVSWPLFNI